MAFNNILCPFSSANTGVGDCQPSWAPAAYLLAVPIESAFNAASFVDFNATLTTLLQNTDITQRGFLLGMLNGATPTDQEVVRYTAPDGSVTTTREEIRMMTYLVSNSNLCIQKTYLAFDGSEDKYAYYIIQKNGYMRGLTVYGTTSPYALTMGGYIAQNIYVKAATEADYTTPALTQIDFNYIDPKNDQRHTIFADTTNIRWDLLAKKGVTNAKFTLFATPTVAGQYRFTIDAGCSNIPISKNFRATGIQLAANYSIMTDAGVALTVDTISVDANGVVTLDTLVDPATSTVVIIGFNGLVTLPTGGTQKYETPASYFDGQTGAGANGDGVFKLTAISA